MNPRVTDDDKSEITVTLEGRELRGWSYKDEDERRRKMVQAREYVEGWCDGKAAPTDNEKAAMFPPPRGGWVCFHCGEVCRSVAEAAIHFGEAANLKPGCLHKLEAGERGLLWTIRELELKRDEMEVRLTAVRLGLDKEGEDEAVERFHAGRHQAQVIQPAGN